MFSHLLDQQLSNDDVGPDLDLGCESLHIHGKRGALFKVTLLSHGYTFVGKGLPIEFLECAKREDSVYSRLDQIQEKYVPVVLGSLVLSRALSYDGIAQIVKYDVHGLRREDALQAALYRAGTTHSASG